MSDVGRICFGLGGVLYLVMGAAHVALVLWDLPRARLFVPVDRNLEAAMGKTSLTMSNRLSVLSTFRGLNLSHGFGVLVFGLMIALLTTASGMPVPGWLIGIALAYGLVNLAIALRYWPGFPAVGYGTAAVLFGLAVVL